MIFSAIIETIDYNTYTCTVQIPDLQGVGDLGPVVRTACIAEMPGLQNSFKAGDIVWVAFVRGEKQYPVVIGKVTNPKNSGIPGGALTAESLNILGTAALPGTVTFNGIESDYNSLSKIIHKLKASINFIERYAGLEFTLDELAQEGGGGTGDIDIEALQRLVSNSMWENITAMQTEESLTMDFPLGKILFVRDDKGQNYSFQSEIDIFPVYSTSTDFREQPLLEFSNAQQSSKYPTKLNGIWKIKAFVEGGFLAQRCATSNMTLNTSIRLLNGQTCQLFDDNGNALSWYWELEGSLQLKSVKSRDLVFLDNDGVTDLTTHKTKRSIFKIGIKLTTGEYKILQQYSSKAEDRAKNMLVVLNLNYDDCKFVNAGGKSLYFESNYTNNSIFLVDKNSNYGIEYIYLPESYNTSYNSSFGTNGLTQINESLFSGSRRLVTVYIPRNTGYIAKNAFSGTGEDRQGIAGAPAVTILNLENSNVRSFGSSAFQNIVLTGAQLRLPRTSIHEKIYFSHQAFYWRYWRGKAATCNPIKTFYVHSPLDFDHAEGSTTPHAGCFYNFDSGTDTSYANLYMKELIYCDSKQEVLNMLRASSLVSFLRTDKNMGDISLSTDEEPIFGSAVPEILRQFEETSETNFTAEVTLTDDVLLQVRFVDYAAHRNYQVGKATIPTIVYNYPHYYN